MKYEIKCKSDSLTGAALVVRIPENELDKKALYTIQADKPEFILPFRSKSVDGSIEFVYQVGLNNKLQYLTGSRRPKEYAELWSSLLSPLLDCGDWFMKPYSFALSAEFLYYDKNKRTAGYVYVPTIEDNSDYGDLREMAAEVSKIILVVDPNLENKVLRAVMKDFDPQGFLHMLRAYTEGAARAMAAYPPLAGPEAKGAAVHVGPPQPARETQDAVLPLRPPEKLPEREGAGEQAPAAGDVLIDIPDREPPKKKGREKAKNGNSKGDKKAAKDKEPIDKRGLFGKKKSAKPVEASLAPMGYGAPAPAPARYAAYPPAPMGYGAPAPAPARYAAYPPAPMGYGAPAPAPAPVRYAAYPPAPMGYGAPAPVPVRYAAYPPAPMGRATPAPVSQYLAYLPTPMGRAAPAPFSKCQPYPAHAPHAGAAAPQAAPYADARDDTQSITIAAGEARLRYIGCGQLPPVIGIHIEEGEIFTIGRYDAAVGGRQSSFEFDRTTKAISRRHAVVERGAEGYRIIDLASSAGTFLNGQKLAPNTPRDLEQGCHVSFGNCGADYVWEK